MHILWYVRFMLTSRSQLYLYIVQMSLRINLPLLRFRHVRDIQDKLPEISRKCTYIVLVIPADLPDCRTRIVMLASRIDVCFV